MEEASNAKAAPVLEHNVPGVLGEESDVTPKIWSGDWHMVDDSQVDAEHPMFRQLGSTETYVMNLPGGALFLVKSHDHTHLGREISQSVALHFVPGVKFEKECLELISLEK